MTDRKAIDDALEILGEEIQSVDYREKKLGPYDLNQCYIGDAKELFKRLPSNSIHCCVTSPPYFGLRTYMPGDHPDRDKEIGIEDNPDDYISSLVEVFSEMRRVLRKDGTAWINIGDTLFSSIKGSGGTNPKTSPRHAGRLGDTQHFKPRKIHGGSAKIKPGDFIGIPFMLAFALREDGWYLRSPTVWSKRDHHQPESVTSRPTKAYEFVFMLTKTMKYYYDEEAIREKPKPWNAGKLSAPKHGPKKKTDGASDQNVKQYDKVKGARKCDVWEIGVESYSGSHVAVYPKSLPSTCIQLGSSERGCCPDCGKPWVRITEKRKVSYGSAKGKMAGADRSVVGSPRSGREDCSFNETTCIGWQPSCKCEAGDPVPCIVLDPFMGSGCTGEAAVDLGRSWLGFDLDERNGRLISKRTAQMSLLEMIAGGHQEPDGRD